MNVMTINSLAEDTKATNAVRQYRRSIDSTQQTRNAYNWWQVAIAVLTYFESKDEMTTDCLIKTVDEILARKRLFIKDGCEWTSLSNAREAMEEYASQFQSEVIPNVKKYICTDCQTSNYLEDNREIRVGECRNCGHPLWNPSDTPATKPEVRLPSDEEIEKEAKWRFTNGHGACDYYEVAQFNNACKWLKDQIKPSDAPIREELRDINFIKWYSGMDEQKIRNAFERYKKETNQK